MKPIHERLRNQLATSRSAKLVIDLLKFDSRIQKAVLYAVGNTVYCDSLEEAKTLAFGTQRLRSASLPFASVFFLKGLDSLSLAVILPASNSCHQERHIDQKVRPHDWRTRHRHQVQKVGREEDRR